jgi:VWFA-related protein
MNAASSARALILLLLTLAGGVIRLDGQPPLPSELAIAAIDRAWPQVNLNVVVLDKSGAPQKIDEQAFQLFEDQTERPLRFPAAEDSPVSLALLIDNSGSAQERKPAIISAIKAIVQALPADSEVTAISFGSVAFLEFPFTPVSKVDLSFMNKVPAEGLTALYDAISETEDYLLGNAKYPRRAVVILSDGEDNASRVRIGTAMDWPGAPMVYMCLIAKAQFLKPETGYGRNHMKFLGKLGGGITFNLDPDPTAAAAQISAAIRNQHVLQFTAADPEHDGKVHKLEVQLPGNDAKIYGLPAYSAPSK